MDEASDFVFFIFFVPRFMCCLPRRKLAIICFSFATCTRSSQSYSRANHKGTGQDAWRTAPSSCIRTAQIVAFMIKCRPLAPRCCPSPQPLFKPLAVRSTLVPQTPLVHGFLSSVSLLS